LETHPNHAEVLKKLALVEEILRAKASQPAASVSKSGATTAAPEHPALSVESEKDSNIRKKSNKIGYV